MLRLETSSVHASAGRDDDAIAGRIVWKHVAPVIADTHPAVEHDQWIAASAILEVNLESVHGDRRHAKQATAQGGFA
jgi:hypothetical protein